MTLFYEDSAIDSGTHRATIRRDLAGKPIVPDAPARDMVGEPLQETNASWPRRFSPSGAPVSKRDLGGWWGVGAISVILIAIALNTAIRNLNHHDRVAPPSVSSAGSLTPN